jgi:hypothetical protein
MARHTLPLSGGSEARRRRVLRVVGVGMGLLRHDGEVEDVAVEDGVRGGTQYAQAYVLKQRCSHRVPRVIQCWLL